MDATHIADQVLTASTALAGLLLIFLGNAAAGIDGYTPLQRTAYRKPRLPMKRLLSSYGEGRVTKSARQGARGGLAGSYRISRTT
jgi:hypothetical protein